MITKIFPFFLLLFLAKTDDGWAAGPHIVISVDGATLRLEQGAKRRVFPAGVGRVEGLGRHRSPVGLWQTGFDPSDRRFYLRARHEPAFHQGLPFIRLRPRSSSRELLFGIHGPVTPTLIWGKVSAGCIRLRPQHIRELFRFARRHPGMPVRIIRRPDRVNGRRVTPTVDGPRTAGCPEARVGARRMRRLRLGRTVVHDRVCGGVDHWFGLELRGGDAVTVALSHKGALFAELYGVRAISAVTQGKYGFRYRVPLVKRNRGNRYLRVVAPPHRRGGAASYTLRISGR